MNIERPPIFSSLCLLSSGGNHKVLVIHPIGFVFVNYTSMGWDFSILRQEINGRYDMLKSFDNQGRNHAFDGGKMNSMTPFVIYTSLSSLPDVFRSEVESVLAKGNPDSWVSSFDYGYLILLLPVCLVAGLLFFGLYFADNRTAPRELNMGEILLTGIFSFIFIATIYHLWLLLSAGSTGWLVTSRGLVGLEGRKTMAVPWSVIKDIRWGTRAITVKKEADTGRVRFFSPGREEKRKRAKEGRPLRIVESTSTAYDLHVEIENHETVTISFGDDYQGLSSFQKNMENTMKNNSADVDYSELAKHHRAPLIPSTIRPYVLVCTFFLAGPFLAYFVLFPYLDSQSEEYLADCIFGRRVQRQSDAVEKLLSGGKLSCSYYRRGFPEGRYIDEVEKIRRRYLDSECEEFRWAIVETEGRPFYRRDPFESLLKTMVRETKEPLYVEELQALLSLPGTEGWFEYAKQSGMLKRIKEDMAAYELEHADEDLALPRPVTETTLIECIYEGWSKSAVLHLKSGTPPDKCLNTLLRLKTLANDNSCRGRAYMLEKLLDAGAPVNVEDIEGSLLHMAVTRNMPKIVRILVAHGADLEKRDLQGRTPLDLAMELGRKELELLVSPEAKLPLSVEAEIPSEVKDDL